MERIDPVLLAMSRDYVGDMAKPCRCSGRPRRRAARPGRRHGSPVGCGRAAQAHEPDGRAGGTGEDARPPRHFGRFALIKLATGALRVGISARLAKQAWGRRLRARRRGGRGSLAWPQAALCRAVRLGRGAWAPAVGQGHAPVPAVHAGPATRGTAGQPTTTPPNGNGTASASRSPMPAAKPASTAAPATIFP